MIRIEIPGLALPRVNVVLRWSRWKRAKEVKRVRALVVAYAAEAGLMSIKPFHKARVTIAACGPYQRRDSDGTWFKDTIDAIVARRMRGWTERRWGLIVDDGPKCIGKAQLYVKNAETYSVVIVVDSREN